MALPQTTHATGRTPIGSILIVAAAVLVAVVLVPSPPERVAEPLPVGSFAVTLPEGEVRIDVDDDATVALTTPDEVVVSLAYDDKGQVLNTFRVESPRGGHHIGLEVGDDGQARVTRRIAMTGSDGGAADEEVVTTVARCAPRGEDVRRLGWPGHGTVISSAASRLQLDLTVTGPDGAPATVEGDFTSVMGARTFCARVAELTQTPLEPAAAVGRPTPGQG